MAELGEELRRERVRRNLTFKDVEQVLHIKTTYLEAIEDGKYDIIPGQDDGLPRFRPFAGSTHV